MKYDEMHSEPENFESKNIHNFFNAICSHIILFEIIQTNTMRTW